MLTGRDPQTFRIGTCICCGFTAIVNPTCYGRRHDARRQSTTMPDVWICEQCLIDRDMFKENESNRKPTKAR